MAHESSHMILGASDEYANATVAGRVIHTDHSLMGNYYSEGIDFTEHSETGYDFVSRSGGSSILSGGALKPGTQSDAEARGINA